MAKDILLFVLLFLQGLCASSICKSKQSKLVIDHDGGADDAMAIFMSLLYEKYFNGPEIVGLTITHGNVNESQAYINTQRILNKAGRQDVKIYRGSTRSLVIPMPLDFFFGEDGLGDNEPEPYQEIPAHDEHAAVALIELSKKYEGELVIMAIAPMTNIALAKRLDPGFIDRLKQIYVGAGTIYSETNNEPEFNAELDAEAYQIVVDNATSDKVTIVPFSQVITFLNISKEWRKNVLGAIPTDIMKAQNSYERVAFAAISSWEMLDPAVAAIILDENIVDDYKYSNNSITLCGGHRGINTNDLESESPNVRVVYSADLDRYKTLLIDIFSAELAFKSNVEQGSETNNEPEFNAELDAEAYQIVVDNATSDKVTIVPFSQVITFLNISKEWRKSVLGAIPTDIMKAQNSYERVAFAAISSWEMLDPAVAAIILDENIVDDYKYSNNSITLCGGHRGINTNDLESESPNVRVVYSADLDRYKTLLIDIFSAELAFKSNVEQGSILTMTNS